MFNVSLWLRATALLAGIAILAATLAFNAAAVPPGNTSLPDAALSISEQGRQTAVFAGGCFWGVEAVFRHTQGVLQATSGYAGGAAKTADYETVSGGTTGHAESVEVVYDAQKISYPQLLKIFFAVAHDPTQLNHQGPDHGTQYRSAIFPRNEAQRRVAEAYIKQLNAAQVFNAPIVTQVSVGQPFYAAESYHQNYLALHPTQPYIVHHDLPKLEQLRTQFAAWYR